MWQLHRLVAYRVRLDPGEVEHHRERRERFPDRLARKPVGGELLRACGFDFELALVPYEADRREDARVRKSLQRTPQERIQALLKPRGR